MQLAIDWLVKFPFQKLLVWYMAEGRNCPVIQEIREQPCDLESGVSVRHPVHLRPTSFWVFSGPLVDRHTSFIAFSGLWSSHCGRTISCFICAATLFAIFYISCTKRPVSEGNFKESLVFFPPLGFAVFFACKRRRDHASGWLNLCNSKHLMALVFIGRHFRKMHSQVHTHTHLYTNHTDAPNSIELCFVMSI